MPNSRVYKTTNAHEMIYKSYLKKKLSKREFLMR